MFLTSSSSPLLPSHPLLSFSHFILLFPYSLLLPSPLPLPPPLIHPFMSPSFFPSSPPSIHLSTPPFHSLSSSIFHPSSSLPNCLHMRSYSPNCHTAATIKPLHPSTPPPLHLPIVPNSPSLTHTQSPIRCQHTQGHDVQPLLLPLNLHTAAHPPYHNIIEVRCREQQHTIDW